jgi:N-methylhydantoinase B/oxoprolinase/acetone carboxylase alpha subunit
MVEEEIVVECRKIWATDNRLRNDVDRFHKFYRAYDEAINDLDSACNAYDEGRLKTNKLIKEFYYEALKYLNEMIKLAQKIKNKRLIDFVKFEATVFEDYKIYLK